jgi:putative tricarboxylic transport membrane protein
MIDQPAPRVAASPRPSNGFARWKAELGIAMVFIVAGALIVNGSLEQGVGWTPTGPESGYFPLRIGWLIVAVGVIQSGIAIAMARRGRIDPSRRESFLRRDRLKPLLQVFVPTLVYIVAVPWLGLYIASALFIAGFMWWHGGYRWRALPTGIAVCAVFYMLLEGWFQVELYKGPLVEWLADALRP